MARPLSPGTDGVSGRSARHDGAVDEARLKRLLDDVVTGARSPDEAVAELRRLPFADIGAARVDHHRALRQGLPEAVYAPGKSAEQCAAIVGELLRNGTGPVLVTRTSSDQRQHLTEVHPGATTTGSLMAWRPVADRVGPTVALLTAGTADGPVADECQGVLDAFGRPVERVDDVGVAGLHRLLAEIDRITTAQIVVVVAGMEGALASVVGGLSPAPVIAVPTSVGYGAGLDGVTALLAMHASCAAGVTVVGIDNGYGAAVAALRMTSLSDR